MIRYHNSSTVWIFLL